MRGEYGSLAADGVYRTTVYTSSPHTGYVVVAQTREQRDQQVDKQYQFNYTTRDSKENQEVRYSTVQYSTGSIMQGTGYKMVQY